MRKMLTVVLTLAAVVCLAPRAHADDDVIYGVNPGSGPMSQGTRDELRIWAGAFWEWLDTGVCPDWAIDFEFSHPEEFPENFVFFADAYEIFGKLYQDHLQPDPRQPGYYTLDDLFQDNPEVYAAFRHYTMTGELRTPVTDANATLKHLVLAAAGLMGDEVDNTYVRTTFVQVAGNQVISDSMVVAVANAGYVGDMATIVPGTPIPSPAQPTVPECLRHFVDLSKLGSRCVVNCLYTKDIDPSWFLFIRTDPGTPGFDCDDFADALIAWLLHYLRGMFPDVEAYQLVHWYTDCNGTEAGHAVVYIKIGNYFYIIEPQTGKITGPFPSTDNPDPRTVLVPCGGTGPGVRYDPNKPVKWKLVPPNKRPSVEPAPWYTNPAMRQHLIDCINQCFPGTNPNPDDYIWDPNNPGTPCTSNCGCDPTKWVMN